MDEWTALVFANMKMCIILQLDEIKENKITKLISNLLEIQLSKFI